MNFIKNLFLLCIVMIFCILAGELALTLFFPIEDPFKKYKESSSQNLFIKRDFVVFYKQTILGPLWYIIQPLLMSVIFTLIFNSL